MNKEKQEKDLFRFCRGLRIFWAGKQSCGRQTNRRYIVNSHIAILRKFCDFQQFTFQIFKGFSGRNIVWIAGDIQITHIVLFCQ